MLRGSTLLVSRGQRTLINAEHTGAPITAELSIAAAHVTNSVVALCLVPSRAVEMVSGARLRARVFERKRIDAPSLEDYAGLSLRQSATAAEAGAVLRSLVSARSRTASGDAVAAKVTAALARAPQLLLGFHSPDNFAELAAGACAAWSAAEGEEARAAAPAIRAHFSGLRDLTAALAVAGVLAPGSAHQVLARSNDASSARGSALHSTRQVPSAARVVAIEGGAWPERPFASATLLRPCLDDACAGDPNATRECAVLSEVLLVGPPATRRRADSLRDALGARAVDPSATQNWALLLPQLVCAACVASQRMVVARAPPPGENLPPPPPLTWIVGDSAVNIAGLCGSRYAHCNRIAGGLLRLARKTLRDAPSASAPPGAPSRAGRHSAALSLLGNAKAMALLVAVAMPALDLGATLGVGVDWEARARLRARCRAALWQRLLHVRASHADKRRLVPLMASEFERCPWALLDWGENPVSCAHARELSNFVDACFPAPIATTFPVVDRAVLSAESGRQHERRAKLRRQSAPAQRR